MVPPFRGFLGVLGSWMTFKKAEMDKTLWNGLSMSETDPSQPQMVGFRDLVRTDFAPVSNKTAVKAAMKFFIKNVDILVISLCKIQIKYL